LNLSKKWQKPVPGRELFPQKEEREPVPDQRTGRTIGGDRAVLEDAHIVTRQKKKNPQAGRGGAGDHIQGGKLLRVRKRKNATESGSRKRRGGGRH